jgi:hypothetical protein
VDLADDEGSELDDASTVAQCMLRRCAHQQLAADSEDEVTAGHHTQYDPATLKGKPVKYVPAVIQTSSLTG